MLKDTLIYYRHLVYNDTECRKIWKNQKRAVDHLLRSVNDTLPPALVFGSGNSIPDGNKDGDDRFNDGGAKLQLDLLQVPLEEHHLLCIIIKIADIYVPLKTVSVCSSQGVEILCSV